MKTDVSTNPTTNRRKDVADASGSTTQRVKPTDPALNWKLEGPRSPSIKGCTGVSHQRTVPVSCRRSKRLFYTVSEKTTRNSEFFRFKFVVRCTNTESENAPWINRSGRESVTSWSWWSWMTKKKKCRFWFVFSGPGTAGRSRWFNPRVVHASGCPRGSRESLQRADWPVAMCLRSNRLHVSVPVSVFELWAHLLPNAVL